MQINKRIKSSSLNIFRYFKSLIVSLINRKEIKNIQAYCLFVGHARSGHTLIGALLNAHPDIVMAQEERTIEFIKSGYSIGQLFSIVKESSKRFVNDGCIKTKYSYHFFRSLTLLVASHVRSLSILP